MLVMQCFPQLQMICFQMTCFVLTNSPHPKDFTIWTNKAEVNKDKPHSLTFEKAGPENRYQQR